MRVKNENLKFSNHNIYFLKEPFLILTFTLFGLISFMPHQSYSMDSMVFTTSDFLPDIKVGDNPVHLVVNPETNTIYVANSRSNTVSVIDGITNNVLSTVEVDNFPGYWLLIQRPILSM